MTLSSPLKLVFPALALLASFLAFEAPAALADTPEKRTLSLSATGAVKTTPDKVDITTGVTAEGQTARRWTSGPWTCGNGSTPPSSTRS
jgi:uncharacterized protein YggE